jgi:hypothetical protein
MSVLAKADYEVAFMEVIHSFWRCLNDGDYGAAKKRVYAANRLAPLTASPAIAAADVRFAKAALKRERVA